MGGRPVSAKEEAYIRRWYGKKTAEEIGRKLDRTKRAVYQIANRLGLNSQNASEASVIAAIEKWHPEGYSDARIASVSRESGLTIDRHRVSVVRRKMGLPANTHSEYQRNIVRQNTKRQLKTIGLKNLGELRSYAFRQFSVRHGWPDHLLPKEALAMEALWRLGPMTRREIAKAIGESSDGPSRHLLKSRKNQTVTSYLLRAGLIIVLPRNRAGKGRGSSCDVYAIKPGVMKHGEDVIGSGEFDAADGKHQIDAGSVDAGSVRKHQRDRHPGNRAGAISKS